MRRPFTRGALALTVVLFASACQDQATAPDAAPPEAPEATLIPSGVEGFPTVGAKGEGWITGRDGRPVQVTYEIQNGMAVIEGDIVLGRAGEIPRTEAALKNAIARGARFGIYITPSSYRWPNGTVPYQVDAGLTNPARIAQAIAMIESANPNIDFVLRTGQADYVNIITSTGCASNVGRMGGQQTIWLAPNCSPGNIAHEMLHTLGMMHEQSRCDRDSYVTINMANVTPGTEINFLKFCAVDGFSDQGTYNFGSIMHYPLNAFSTNPSNAAFNTITPIVAVPGGTTIGQRHTVGASDIETINSIYPVQALQLTPSTLILNLVDGPSSPPADAMAGVRALADDGFIASADGVRKHGTASGPVVQPFSLKGTMAQLEVTHPVTLKNNSGGTLSWLASTDQLWVTVAGGGTLSAGSSVPMNVYIDTSGLTEGLPYEATATVSATGVASRTVGIRMAYWNVLGLTNAVAHPFSGLPAGEVRYFKVVVPAGATNLVIQTASGGTGDADLYVRYAALPGFGLPYDCRPFSAGSNETCTTPAPAAGTYYIMVHAFHPNALTATLTASYTPAPAPTPPAAPSTMVTTLASPSSIDLSWTDNSSNETRFEISRHGKPAGGVYGAYANIHNTDPGVTTFTDTGLLANYTYQYRVRACNAQGCSNYAIGNGVSTLTVPLKPTAVTTVAASSTSITFGWTDASDNEANFEIQRQLMDLEGNYGPYEALVTRPANSTSYTNTGLLVNRRYRYRVRACNAAGCSNYINGAGVLTPTPPEAPTSATVVATSGTSLRPSWTDASTNESRFEVQRRNRTEAGTFGAWTTVVSTTPNTTFYNNTGLTQNVTYQFRVRACNDAGCSAYVQTQQIVTPTVPAAPGTASTSILSSVSLQPTWTDASNNEVRFEVQRRMRNESGVFGSFTLVASPAPNVTSYIDTGLTPGGRYQYRVRACNAAGCSAYTTSLEAQTPTS